MALINCPECGQQVSDKAEVCIHCGAPLKEKPLEPVHDKDKYAQNRKKGTVAPALWAVVFGVLGVICSVFSIVLGLALAALSVYFLTRFRKNTTKKWIKVLLTILVVLLAISSLLFGIVSSADISTSETSSVSTHRGKVSEKDVKAEAETMVRAKYMSYILNDCVVTVNITNVSKDGDQYTVYGKVSITDQYKDTYTGRFTIVLESRSYGLVKISEDYEKPYK